MKKKLVVKTLALLLTSVMVMETPMQSFAAENTTITAEAGASAEETQNGTTGETEGQPATEQQDAEGQPQTGNTVTDTGSASESGTGTESGDTQPAEGAASDEQQGDDFQQNEEGSQQSNGAANVESSAATLEDNIDGNEAVSQNVENSSVRIQARQFGDTQVSVDETKLEKVSAARTVLEVALKDKKADVTLNPDQEGEKVTSAELNQLLSVILERSYGQETYATVLPDVAIETENGNVTKVTFSYTAFNAHIDKASWDNDSVAITYGYDTSNATSFNLVEIPVNGEEPVWADAKVIENITDKSYTYNPEKPGNYKYILLGYKDGKVSTYSKISDTFAYSLPAVTGLKVTSVDRNSISLSWDKLNRAEKYTLVRTNTKTNAVKETEIADPNTTTYKDTALENDAEYSYKIVASCTKPYEEGTWTSDSAAVETVSPVSGMAKPGMSYQSNSSDQAVLNWNGVSGAEGYELYNSADGSYTDIGNVTSYTLNGLIVGQNYTYAVCPYKTVKGIRVYGTLSDTVNVTTALSGSSVQASAAAYNQINLAWTQTAQADGYEIYRNGQLLQTVWGGSSCSYADTAIACGTTYSYQVRAFKNTNGTTSYGAFSGEASAVTSLPGTSMQGASSQEYQTVTITWNQGVGATGYELYRSNTSGTNYSLLADITDGNTTSYRDTAVTVGATWFYKVKPYRVENGQKVYGPETGEVSGLVTLGSVSGVNAWASAYNRIELTWNKLSYATGYEIYYSTSPDSGYQFLKRVGKGASKFKWSKAQCGTTYYFQIRPIQKVKKVTNYGTFSNAVSAMTTIGTPSATVKKVTYDSMTLRWKAVKGAKGYKIYVSDSADGSYQYYMTTKRTSNVLKKLEAGRTYYFKVTAFRDNYESPLSGTISGRPSIGAVTKLKVVSQSGTELKVSWKKVKGAEKYVILRSGSQNGVYTQVGETNKAFYTDGGLANSTTYFYKVYAVRGNCASDQVGPVNARTRDAGSVNTDEDKKSIYKGIDVSSYQGDINWEAVAKDGIDFAMIRILTGKDASAIKYDSKFKTNYSGARAAGLNVGVYRYSYATSRTLARREAKAVINALDGRKLDYPIVMDFEDSSILQGTSTNSRRAEIILAFKEEVEKAGYKFALYANKNWLDNYIDTGMLGDTHIWIARWRSLESGHGYTGRGTVTMWQYTDAGSVKGISGKVDMDVSYKKYR